MLKSAPTVSVIDSAAEFARLRESWNALLACSRSQSICLTWEWLFTWWEVYADASRVLMLIVVRDGEEVIGIAPFQMHTTHKLGVPIRTIRFLGTGENDSVGVVSEYLDILADINNADVVVECIAAYLSKAGDWDRLLFDDLLDEALVFTRFRKAMSNNAVGSAQVVIGIRYSIALPQTWEAYLAQLDAGAARRMRYYLRRLEREGALSESVVANEAELADAFEQLTALHNARWQSKGKTGAFASDKFSAFHAAFARKVLPLGYLNFRCLRLDGKPIASVYNFRIGGTDYFYQGGIGAAGSKFSPGVVAQAYAIQAAISAGIDHYDFMRGEAGSYKSGFGCVESPMYVLKIFAPTLRGRALAALQRGR